MAEYIERDAFIADKKWLYCTDCEKRKGKKRGKMVTLYEIGEAPCKSCGIHDMLEEVEMYPAADVRPVVLCKDCVYWQKPQVKLNDGTYRDYEPGEYENGSPFGGVTSDVGINIGSFCAMYNTEHQNRIPQFMGENDFCSKGYKRGES